MVIVCVIDGYFNGAIPWFKEAKEGSGAIGGEESEGKCSNLQSYYFGC